MNTVIDKAWPPTILLQILKSLKRKYKIFSTKHNSFFGWSFDTIALSHFYLLYKYSAHFFLRKVQCTYWYVKCKLKNEKNWRQIVFTVYKYKMTWTLNFDRIKKLKKVCCQAIAYEFHMFLENAIFFFIHKIRSTRILKKVQCYNHRYLTNRY